jgi:hypothetical protein
VSQSRFTVLKILSRNILGEFMGIFQKRSDPLLKFKQVSNWNFSWNLQFKIQRYFEVGPKRKATPFEVVYHHEKFGIF